MFIWFDSSNVGTSAHTKYSVLWTISPHHMQYNINPKVPISPSSSYSEAMSRVFSQNTEYFVCPLVPTLLLWCSYFSTLFYFSNILLFRPIPKSCKRLAPNRREPLCEVSMEVGDEILPFGAGIIKQVKPTILWLFKRKSFHFLLQKIEFLVEN